MNLFDNLIQSQTNQFTNKVQPQVPSFATPQAPRTSSYVAPTIAPKTLPSKEFGVAPGYEGTVDQTKTPLFNAIQGSADLFTGIKKRLGETVKEDQSTFNTALQEKQKTFVSDMLAKGHSKEDIFKALDTLKSQGQFDFNPGISESIVGGIGNRMQNMENTTQKLSQIQDPLARTVAGVIPYAGQTVATATQPLASALEPYVSPVVKAIVEKTGQTQNIQDLSNQWSEFEKTNPILAENIAGALNVAQLAPVPFAKPVAGAIEQGVKTTGKALVKGAEYVAPKVVQGVKKITPTLPKAEDLLVNQLEKTNRMNPTKYTEFQQLAGERAGKFMADRKITGNTEENVSKLYDNFTKSKAEADTGLDAIQKTYKSSELPSGLKDMMSELQKRFIYTKDAGALKTVSEAINKAENGILSHSDINAIKRLYEQKVKVNYIKDQNSLEVERATNIDNDVRNWQFDEASKLGFDNLKLINKETQLNRYLADNIGDKLARQLGNNNISLTDWIIAGQVPGTPQALALLAGKKLAQNLVPKLYQKGLEKVAKLPTKNAPVANIKNINKMETIRKSVNTQYDPNRLLISPRNSSRTPTTITPEVTLPTGEKGKQTIKSPAIKSDITSKSIIRENGKLIQGKPKKLIKSNESKVNKPKPKSISVDVNNKQQVSTLEKEYVTKMKKGKNLVIDSDKIKEQFSDYDPKNPTTVHEKSSELSKIYYKNALKDPSYNKVVLTAGGGGSGKSEILVSGIPQNSGTLVFDGTGKNFKKIVSQYDEAKKAGKDAEIKAVYIDYNKARKFNAKRDRTVAEDILADTHRGYRKTLLQIAKERPDIKISLYINLGVRDKNGNAISRRIPREKIVNFLEAHQELER